MKYKEKFLDLQVKVLNNYRGISEEFHDIESILNNIQVNIDSRRREISPELYEDLTKKLYDAIYKCQFNSLIKRQYYGDNN